MIITIIAIITFIQSLVFVFSYTEVKEAHNKSRKAHAWNNLVIAQFCAFGLTMVVLFLSALAFIIWL